MEEDFGSLENKHKELKEENKSFREKLKKYNINHRGFYREIEGSDTNSDYGSLLELEQRMISISGAVDKLVELQKKKYPKTKIALERGSQGIQNNIKEAKLRNTKAVLEDERHLKIKNTDLSDSIQKIHDYEIIISDSHNKISRGVKKYDTADIEDFEGEIDKYQEKIGKLNEKIYDLENKRTNLENRYEEGRNFEYSEELDEDLDNVHTKLSRNRQGLIDHINESIEDYRDSINDYENDIQKLKDKIEEDEYRLTEEEMAEVKVKLPKWYHILDLEKNKKIGLEGEIKPLKTILDKDKTAKINNLRLKLLIQSKSIKILDKYAELRINNIRASKENIIGKYKSKEKKSIKNHLTIFWKKITL